MSFSLLYVTHPSKPEADRISIGLLNEKLIACANSFPIDSLYHWDGSIARTQEFVTLYKTKNENIEAIKRYIENNHKYDIPCIMKIAEVSSNEGYENWIRGELLS
ncbi:MAG: divalent-cation tolerance protein CutA [Candidatus Altimarinota bacterium]